MWISRLKRVRRTILVLGIANLAVIVSGCVLTLVSNSNCDSAAQLSPLYAVCLAACVKLAAMVKVATTQELMVITSLLGIRLRCRFPNLYVYAYGPLPCVDQDVAEACSEFVTSIVLDKEFSSRLSYGSIRRLQVAAIKVLSQDPKADTALIFRLARRFLSASKRQRQHDVEEQPTREAIPSIIVEDSQESLQKQEEEVYPILEEAVTKMMQHDEEFINPFHEMAASTDNQFMETVPTRVDDEEEEAPEMFLPGLVIHIVHEGNNMSVPIWRGWPICDATHGGYKAYVANRESFKEIMVSPSMFLDHLPWRCRHAMQKVLESRNLYCDLTSESDIV
ncbi:hypothetical protein N665_0139s0007 [Sinapis alba]|nr:hypothetical protein N665_0139s0007 [Sinapis alba]